MTTAVDVATYIRKKRGLLGEMQLQKLAYYSQAWSLAWDGKPLFSSEILAWEMGPVTPDLRRYPVHGPVPTADSLSPEQEKVVDAVLAFYGHLNGTELSKRTHGEAPWADAYAKRPEGSTRCTEEITQDVMRRFYSAQAIMGEDVPERPADANEAFATDDEVLAIARRTSSEWATTLEILSR